LPNRPNGGLFVHAQFDELGDGFVECCRLPPCKCDQIEAPHVRGRDPRRQLEKAGVTQALLAKRMFEGLNAVETKFFLRRWPIYGTRDTDAKSANPAQQTADAKATLTGQSENDDDVHADELIRRDLIAFSERREMLELAIKVLGLSRAEEQKLKVHLTLEQILGQSWSGPAAVKK
jgi:hypothetical protein